MRRPVVTVTAATDGTLRDGIRAIRYAGHGSARTDWCDIVPLGLKDGMFAYALPDGLLELGRLEQGGAVGNAGEGLIGLEDPTGHAHVDFLGGFEVESKTTQHESDQTACAGANDKVEVIAGLGDLVAAGGLAFAFDVGTVHKFLEEDEHRVTSNATTVWSSKSALYRTWRKGRVHTQGENPQRRAFGGVLAMEGVDGVHIEIHVDVHDDRRRGLPLE